MLVNLEISKWQIIFELQENLCIKILYNVI